MTAADHDIRVREVWLVRHGATEWSESHRHTGRTDVPLTTEGAAAARRVGERLRAERFELVLTSPAQRAFDTAMLAGFRDAELDGDIREWDYGAYEGRTTAEEREEVPDWSVWTHPVTDGESVEQVGARADEVIERLHGVDGRVLLFSHGHFSRILAARWLGLPPAAGRHFVLMTATVSVLGWERETPALLRWNA